MSIRTAEQHTTPPTSLADVMEIQREAIRFLRQGQGRLHSGEWTSARDAIRSALRRVEELTQLQ